MSNVFSDAADFLNDALAGPLGGSASVSVTYVRGTLSCPWNATVASSEWQIASGEELLETWTSRDYVGAAADLAAGGITLPPLSGDRIVEVIGAQKVTHEVTNGGSSNNSQCYRYSDTGESRLRVHTKEISRV